MIMSKEAGRLPRGSDAENAAVREPAKIRYDALLIFLSRKLVTCSAAGRR